MRKEEYIFGIYPVLEAIRSEVNLDKIFVLKGSTNPRIQEIIALTTSAGVSVSEVPVEKLDRMTRSNHQGVVAVAAPISFSELSELVESAISSDTTPLFLILDQLSDVRNFGAIIRTAECTQVTGIIIQKKGGAPVSGDTVKTSAGAIFNVPICKVDHIKDAIYYLQGSGIKIVAATEKANESVYDIDLSEPMAILMGSEGKGVNPSILKIADKKAALPLKGQINSLNVSVACGVFLYEVLRQRMN